MTQYVLLIHADEGAWERLPEDRRASDYERYATIAREMQARGHARGGDELTSAATAKVVRIDDGERSITDGPFIETKEQLGGYFAVECDLETALDYAARIPAAEHGAIEVREVAEGR